MFLFSARNAKFKFRNAKAIISWKYDRALLYGAFQRCIHLNIAIQFKS